MLASFFIGIREGLEAALIIAILVAYLTQNDLRRHLRTIAWGVAAAVGVSLAAAGVLELTSNALSEEFSAAFEAVTSLVAVALIAWMTLWMARHARTMKSDLHNALDNALGSNVFAIAGVAFFAVLREGLETSVFMWASIRTAGETLEPVIGLVLGLAISLAAGYGLYRGFIKLPISKVFTYVGGLLIFFGSSVLAYGVHELQELGFFPVEEVVLWDTRGVIDPYGLAGSLMRGILGYRGEVTLLEAIAWVGYILIVGALFKNALQTPTEQREKVSA